MGQQRDRTAVHRRKGELSRFTELVRQLRDAQKGFFKSQRGSDDRQKFYLF